MNLLATPVLPSDLRDWMPEQRLIWIALEAVQAVDWESAPGQAPSFRVPQGPLLMTILAYSYASGIFRSREIEQLAQRDRAVRYLCAHRPLDWNSLRVFRRQHVGALARCLALVLEAAWAWKLAEVGLANSATSYAQNSMSRWTPHGPKPDFFEAAQGRVANAVQADSMEMDE